MAVQANEVPAWPRLGGALVLLSAVAWSLAGPLTKGVEADAWAVLAWRGLFSGAAILAYAGWRSGGMGDALRGMGWPGWSATLIGSAATVAFISSFKLTSVAHVAVIYGTVPLLAAAVGWLWLRERTAIGTLMASGLALAGVAMMVAGGDVIGGGAVGGADTSSIGGDVLAMLMTVGMATLMVMIRRYRAAPMVLAAGLSSGQLLVVGLIVGVLVGGTDPLAMPGSEIAVMAVFGLLHAAAVVLLTEGTRLVPAPEAALLGAAEVPLAPVWGFLLLGEGLPPATLLGGGMVIAALFWYLGRRCV